MFFYLFRVRSGLLGTVPRPRAARLTSTATAKSQQVRNWKGLAPLIGAVVDPNIGGKVLPGFGLDPKGVDVDRDGDIDLVTPGRSGLYYFENLVVE